VSPVFQGRFSGLRLLWIFGISVGAVAVAFGIGYAAEGLGLAIATTAATAVIILIAGVAAARNLWRMDPPDGGRLHKGA
jgi:hypothetical protein